MGGADFAGASPSTCFDETTPMLPNRLCCSYRSNWVDVPRPMTHDKLERNSPTPYALVPAGGPQRVRAPAPSSSSSSSSSSLAPPPLPVICRSATASMATTFPYPLDGREMSQQSGIKHKV